MTGRPIDQSVSYTVITRDGRKIWAELDVKIKDSTSALIVARDVTERKRAENALQESKNRFRSVLENSRDVIYRLNIQSGLYEYVSPASRQTVGYSPEELMALDVKAAMEMVHPEDIPIMQEALAHAEKTGLAEAEYRQKTKAGGYIWMSNRMSVIRDAAGKSLYRDGIIRDITERKNAEEKLNRRTAELESAVAELDSFTYSVSHDLRAPLRAIDGFSRILLKEASERLSPEDVRMLRMISKNSEKMELLIDDLLMLSRTGRAEIRFDLLNIKSVVEDIWREILAGNPDRNMEIKIGDLPPARGDRTLLRQVFSNLIGNAVKFTKNMEKAVITVTGFNSAEFNTYCVKDNGVGFDMKYYDKLFGIFRRLHSESQYEGTGVGLVIVKKIIERHGGRIWAESKPGEGAAFYFALPATINTQD